MKYHLDLPIDKLFGIHQMKSVQELELLSQKLKNSPNKAISQLTNTAPSPKPQSNISPSPQVKPVAPIKTK